MDEENELCRYGTPLDPIEEDQVPSKKPIAKEDQIAVDANGRRRFHGAFTGGFSAGFWNTVGSQEGWKPQTFKSSRKDKAGKVTQSVEDFMDSEDTGEFGIAPKRIQAQEDFTSGSGGQKRKYTVAFETTNLENVLQKLMMPSRDNIGTRLLRKMGWREGQGVGVRLTKRAKKQAERQHRKEQQLARRYGCDLGLNEKSEEESSSDDSGAEVTFAPDDFDTFTISPKDNTFGLGYSGLDRSLVHQKPGKSEAFAILGKNNRKMMISGKGFGLGALEDDDDEDIYSRDDMTQYDFSLDDQKTPKNRGKVQGIEMGTLEGFMAAADPTTGKFSCKIFRIDLPRDFQARHFLQRKSRFAPLPPEIEKHLKESFKSDKHALSDSKPQSSRQGTSQENPPKIQEPQKPQRNYKLFLNDPDKQERFDKFLEISEKSSEAEVKAFFQANQPLNLSQYAREMEQREFLQARKMHKPLAGLMSDRFVSENTLKSTEEPEKPSQEKPEEVLGQTEGPDNTGFYSKRVKVMWKPDSLLCKRFNVPEPFGGMMTGKEEKTKHRKSSNIFECLRDPISQRIDFTASKIQESPKEIPQIVERVEPAKVQTEIPPEMPKIQPELPPPGRPERLEPKETKEVPPPIKRPKNELEMAVLEAKDKHPADKKDLFRAIFEDSEESEDEKEEEPQEKAPVKEDINPLRNPSEPQGIFSKIFFVRKAAEKKKEELEKIVQDAKETEKIQESSKDEDDPEIFGPKLPPPTFQNPAKVIPARNFPETLGIIGDRRGEKWVEKNEVDRKKKKKEKHSKEKKHKKRKKKHKSRD
uniref:Uncharacterized protein n=1 Tax=Phlebotomus papatasi TaxID=29031 RepID=A0A1B0D335_PHLPP